MENKLFEFCMADSTFELVEEVTGEAKEARTSYRLREIMSDKSERIIFNECIYDKSVAYRLATIFNRIKSN